MKYMCVYLGRTPVVWLQLVVLSEDHHILPDLVLLVPVAVQLHIDSWLAGFCQLRARSWAAEHIC